MSELKTLANCDAIDFLRQTNKIRKAVSKWLEDTDIVNIFRTKAVEEVVTGNDEEQAAIIERNANARRKQIMKNLSDILDKVLEEHPEETLEILALCCFIEPKDANSHKVAEYLTAFNSLISDKAVIDFFVSLAKLGQIDTLSAAKA